MITDRQVEVAARAIYALAVRDMLAPLWPHPSESRRQGYRVLARAALDAADQTKLCEEIR